MMYTGSREKLASKIRAEIKDFTGFGKSDLEDWTLYDICSGMAYISKLFLASNMRVIANDSCYYAYIITSSFLDFGYRTGLQGLYNYLTNSSVNTLVPFQIRTDIIYEYLNRLQGVEGFITKYYTSKYTPKTGFFSIGNAMKIDAIRQEIERFDKAGAITPIEKNYLIATLLLACDNVVNAKFKYDCVTKCRYGDKNLIVYPVKFAIENKYRQESVHNTTCKNVESLVISPENPDKSIVFCDPSFQTLDYDDQYGLPITIAKYDNPPVRGMYHLRPKSITSNFCRKSTYMNALKATYDCCNAKYFVFCVPKSDFRATFDHYQIEHYFRSLDVKRFEIRKAFEGDEDLTPWRLLRPNAKVLYLYCIERY